LRRAREEFPFALAATGRFVYSGAVWQPAWRDRVEKQ